MGESYFFRERDQFAFIRDEVLPGVLARRTPPMFRAWCAGCASGEEPYSLAILLHEEGLLRRCRIYATDINEAILDRARNGIFALRDMQTYTRNYQLAGGSGEFADYYQARYDHALMLPALRDNILFSPHNLAADAEFGEMHLVLCRNVLIYFNPDLKERALRLFDTALTAGGFLCLGMKETLEFRSLAASYTEMVKGLRIYRKEYPD